MQNKKKPNTVSATEAIQQINREMVVLLEKFEQDMHTIRNLQKNLVPSRFPDIKGLELYHKYIAGMKSGGDYLDVFEFEDKENVGFLMSDSNGYGISSTFLTLILRVGLNFQKSSAKSPSEILANLVNELKGTMKEKEGLSLFLGVLNRKNFTLTYAGSGDVRFFVQSNSKKWKQADCSKEIISLDKKIEFQDHSMHLEPGDRLLLLSDGFYNTFENYENFVEMADKLRSKEPIDVVNELNFRIKKEYEEADDLAEQDCTLLCMDVSKNLIRLAK